jgi:hypothetical protein
MGIQQFGLSCLSSFIGSGMLMCSLPLKYAFLLLPLLSNVRHINRLSDATSRYTYIHELTNTLVRSSFACKKWRQMGKSLEIYSLIFCLPLSFLISPGMWKSKFQKKWYLAYMLYNMKGSVMFSLLLDSKQDHVEKFTMTWIGAVLFEEKCMRAHTHSHKHVRRSGQKHCNMSLSNIF